MYVKMMGNENAPDRDNSKSYQLIECDYVKFSRNDGGEPFATVCRDGSAEIYTLTGNAYVLNDSGKTVDAFSYSEAPPNHPRIA